MRLMLTAAIVLLSFHVQDAAAQEDCARPWLVVVKKDGSLVEGWMLKDVESGVLVDVNGRTVLVPEADINEVVEDCERKPPTVAAAPAPAPRAPVARPAPAPAQPSRAAQAEASTRNSVINFSQYMLRWGGGLCISCGGGLFSTTMLIGVITLANAIATGASLDPRGATMQSLGLMMGLLLAISGAIAGTGVGMVLSAQLAEFLRPSNAAPPAPTDAEDIK